MTFHEDWFSAGSRAVLRALAEAVHELDGAVVEVGCWEGRSTVELANASYPTVVHAVDTWLGAPSEPTQLEAARERDVLSTFRANVARLTRGNVLVHQTGWRELFTDWDEPLKLLHVDAEHTYSEVADNLRVALPLVVPGGVLCGDDAQHEPVLRAARDVLGSVDVQESLWVWRQPCSM